jgi:hypothetical protein
LENVPAPLPAEPERPVRAAQADSTITLPAQTIAPGQGELVLDFQLPAKHHLSLEAPQRAQMRVEGNGAKLEKSDVRDRAVTLPLRIPLEVANSGEGTVIVSAGLFYCTDTNSVCKARSLRLKVPFKVAEGASKQITVRQPVEG